MSKYAQHDWLLGCVRHTPAHSVSLKNSTDATLGVESEIVSLHITNDAPSKQETVSPTRGSAQHAPNAVAVGAGVGYLVGAAVGARVGTNDDGTLVGDAVGDGVGGGGVGGEPSVDAGGVGAGVGVSVTSAVVLTNTPKKKIIVAAAIPTAINMLFEYRVRTSLAEDIS